MNPRSYLRIEGLAAFALAVASYLALDGQLWLLLVLALAPLTALTEADDD